MKNIVKIVALSSVVLFNGCNTDGTITDNNSSVGDVLNGDKPKITLAGDKNILIDLGTQTINEEGYSAYDEEDGDLTYSIERKNDIDFTKIGEYTITYTVRDSDGNVDEAYRYVKIVNPLGDSTTDTPPDPYYNDGQNYQGSAPVIKLLRYEREFNGPLYLPLGSEYDIAYSATDFEDGNIGYKVTITGANFDPNKMGTYLVTYSVTDSNNNSVSKTLTVIVGNTTTWTDNSSTDTLSDFISWYSSECGKTFNRSLYSETTGRYSGTISCSSKNLTYVDLSSLSVFSSINSIDLSHNRLDEIDFTPLANTQVINKIDLSYNNFSYIDFSPLYNLHNINELWINGNNLNYTRAEREALFRGFNNKSFTIYF